MKQAVILAAGQGSRLTHASNGVPKCLVKVGGTPLIEHQLGILEEVGIERVCVVVGHDARTVRSAASSRCEFIVNHQYASTNSLYSLWLAREWVSGPFVLMNCDVLAHPDIYHRVMAVNGSALAYDSASGKEDEHMKVCIKGGLVRSLGKQLPREMVDGENVGVLQFDEAAARLLFIEAREIIDSGTTADWAPAAVDRLAKRIPIRGVDVTDLPWTEIDFPDDLHSAEHSIWPLIETGRWVRPERLAS